MAHFATEALTMLLSLTLVECFKIDPRLSRIDKILEQSYIQRNLRDLEYPTVNPNTLQAEIRMQESVESGELGNKYDESEQFLNENRRYSPNEEEKKPQSRECNKGQFQSHSTANPLTFDLPETSEYAVKEEKARSERIKLSPESMPMIVPSFNYVQNFIPMIPMAVPGVIVSPVNQNFNEEFDGPPQASSS